MQVMNKKSPSVLKKIEKKGKKTFLHIPTRLSFAGKSSHFHPCHWYIYLFIYLFNCDVYTGNPIQRRWFKRRPVYILVL